MPPYSDITLTPEDDNPALAAGPGPVTKVEDEETLTSAMSFSSESSNTFRDLSDSDNRRERRATARPRRSRVQSMSVESKGARDFFGTPPAGDTSPKKIVPGRTLTSPMSFSSESSNTIRDLSDSDNRRERRATARPCRSRVQSMSVKSKGAQDFFGTSPAGDTSPKKIVPGGTLTSPMSFSSESGSDNRSERQATARPRRSRVQSMTVESKGAQDFFGAPPPGDTPPKKIVSGRTSSSEDQDEECDEEVKMAASETKEVMVQSPSPLEQAKLPGDTENLQASLPPDLHSSGMAETGCQCIIL